MSDAQDIAAIQTYLKNVSTQVSAAVDTCATLDAATKGAWYALAASIVTYVSAASPDLARGRALRGALNAMIASLTTKGCGNLSQLIHDAPPPAPAPPPKGTPNPLLDSPLASILTGPQLPWLILLALYLLSKGRR